MTAYGQAKSTYQALSSEEGLLETITTAATLLGWRWHHIRRSDRAEQQGQPGFPDLILVKGSRLLAWELKSEQGAVMPGQADWLAAFYKAGAEAMVIRPSDLEQVIAMLEGREVQQ